MKSLSPVVLLLGFGLMLNLNTYAQESSDSIIVPVKVKPVKNTFPGVWIIDNQTVMLPIKGTMEMDVQHRFGTVTKGYENFWGLFAPSNIRLGFSYAPTSRLNLGFGITKSNMLWDVSAKYALLLQTKGRSPVSVTYYGNAAYDTRKDPTTNDGSTLNYDVERFSFFNQLIIARKITEKLSVQVAPSISHQNAVSGFYTKNDSTGQETFKSMKFDHFAISVAARYKITEVTSIIMNYDQPLTQHPTNNPNPNLGLGLEFNTSGHSFQVFFSNFALLNQQRNNLYNNNNPFKYTVTTTDDKGVVTKSDVKGGQFLIGFNITRLFN